jgi:integrase
MTTNPSNQWVTSMAIKRTPLTQAQVDAIKTPGRHFVAEGLALRVRDTGTRTWLAQLPGKRFVTIGHADSMKLSQAKAAAGKLLNSDQVAKASNYGRTPLSFKEAAYKHLEIARQQWKVPKGQELSKTEVRWINFIENYFDPVFGKTPVLKLKPADVAEALGPYWFEKTPSALKARQMCERVIQAEIAKTGELIANPANADFIHAILTKPDHETDHIEMPTVDELRTVMKKLNYGHITHHAMAWLVQSLARSNSVRWAEAEQFNFDTNSWDIPAEIVKMTEDFRVPLTKRMLKMAKTADPGLLFPNGDGTVLSANAFRSFCIKRGLSWRPHGIRATFRSWAQEQGVAKDVADFVIDHRKRHDETDTPYARSDILEIRREIVEEWGKVIFG